MLKLFMCYPWLFLHLWIICGYFLAALHELINCIIDTWTHKCKIILRGLYGKCLLTSALLNDHMTWDKLPLPCTDNLKTKGYSVFMILKSFHVISSLCKKQVEFVSQATTFSLKHYDILGHQNHLHYVNFIVVILLAYFPSNDLTCQKNVLSLGNSVLALSPSWHCVLDISVPCHIHKVCMFKSMFTNLRLS